MSKRSQEILFDKQTEVMNGSGLNKKKLNRIKRSGNKYQIQGNLTQVIKK